LSAVNLIKQVAADIVAHKPEGLIERPARGDDAQVMVEHDQRVTDGIDDGMRERKSVFEIDKRSFFRQRRS
jgi:hypothetical protein